MITQEDYHQPLDWFIPGQLTEVQATCGDQADKKIFNLGAYLAIFKNNYKQFSWAQSLSLTQLLFNIM